MKGISWGLGFKAMAAQPTASTQWKLILWSMRPNPKTKLYPIITRPWSFFRNQGLIVRSIDLEDYFYLRYKGWSGNFFTNQVFFNRRAERHAFERGLCNYLLIYYAECLISAKSRQSLKFWPCDWNLAFPSVGKLFYELRGDTYFILWGALEKYFCCYILVKEKRETIYYGLVLQSWRRVNIFFWFHLFGIHNPNVDMIDFCI